MTLVTGRAKRNGRRIHYSLRNAAGAVHAAKAEYERAYRVRHCWEWMVGLGDGNDERHRRAHPAIDDPWAYTGQMFAVDYSERGLINRGIAIGPAPLRSQWFKTVSGVVAE